MYVWVTWNTDAGPSCFWVSHWCLLFPSIPELVMSLKECSGVSRRATLYSPRKHIWISASTVSPPALESLCKVNVIGMAGIQSCLWMPWPGFCNVLPWSKIVISEKKSKYICKWHSESCVGWVHVAMKCKSILKINDSYSQNKSLSVPRWKSVLLSTLPPSHWSP